MEIHLLGPVRVRARRHWQHALKLLTDLGIEHTEDEETTTAAIRAHLATLARRR